MLQDLAPAVPLTPRQQVAVERLVAARRAREGEVRAETPPRPRTRREIQRRLQALYHHGYVQRLQLSDSDPIIYALGNRGADELLLHYGIDRQKIDWTSKNRDVGERYIQHGLMVSRFRHALELALRERSGATLRFWEPGGAFRTAVEYQETVPTRDGGRETQRARGAVVPDGFFALEAGGKTSYLFLEADRSTMQTTRYLAKLKHYFHFWTTQVRGGTHPSGMKGFRVLTITLSEARKEHLRLLAREVDPQGLGLNLFWFACERVYETAPPRLLDAIWQTPPDDTLKGLLA
jgi:hypothetical protein